MVRLRLSKNEHKQSNTDVIETYCGIFRTLAQPLNYDMSVSKQ